MPTVAARPRTEGVRKRRTHAKSKKGCGNCKLRRVKCDETQPSCRKCMLYSVACDYSERTSFLDLDAQGSFQVQLEPTAVSKPPSSNIELFEQSRDDKNEPWTSPLLTMTVSPTLTTIIDKALHCNTSDRGWTNKSWHFSHNQLQVLLRFRNRTALTIGSIQMARVYRDLVCHLACKHSFLMHMLLSVTMMHDAHLADPTAGNTKTASSQTALEHWNTASKLFNSILSQPIPPSYRDAIWATGVFLGAASFWSIGSTNPYDVWPLKPAESDDLSWLRIGEGKKHLWRLAQPSRSDSIFSSIVKDNSCVSVPEWAAVDTSLNMEPHISSRVWEIFGMTSLLSEPKSVYYHPILALSKCPSIKLTQENAMKFLYVMAVITPEFLELLEMKDMKAVFIMGWWYSLLTTGNLWWMSRRAKIEGQAIRIWLRRQKDGAELAGLLDEIESLSRKEEETTKWFFEP